MDAILTTDSLGEPQALALLNLDQDEAATIYFALMEYATRLERGLDDLERGNDAEDRAFLHAKLAKVYGLMFDLRDNHAPAAQGQMVEWLGI